MIAVATILVVMRGVKERSYTGSGKKTSLDFKLETATSSWKKQSRLARALARTALTCRPCESGVAVASAHRPVTSARPGTLGQDATHRGGAGNIHPAIVAGAHACQSRPGCRQYQGPHEPGIQLRTGTAIISKTMSQVGMPACLRLRLTMPAKRPGSGFHPGRDDLRGVGGGIWRHVRNEQSAALYTATSVGAPQPSKH